MALRVKSDAPVLVCIGNPPYDRHQSATKASKPRTGGWVRWGDDGSAEPPILEAFVTPAKESRHGVHLKNLYNLYIYFWRWALWKVFEHESAEGPGVVSSISASSYIDGDTSRGVREHLRRICDWIWILDLGGEWHAPPRDENVFAIRTPVAIAVAARTGAGNGEVPAEVRYARVDGNRNQKLAALGAVTGFDSVDWDECRDGWQAPFRPVRTMPGARQAIATRSGHGNYFLWPRLTDLMPWQHSGVQLKRTWPIAPDEDTLRWRWWALLSSADRARSFRETTDRRIDKRYRNVIGSEADSTHLAKLSVDAPMPPSMGYGYRSFDRQRILADTRLMSRPRPALWHCRSESQIYLPGLLTKKLGSGPALTASAILTDLDHFSGRGAKDTIPFYRTADSSEPNLAPGLLQAMAEQYGAEVSAEDLLAYACGALAHPRFAESFTDELEHCDIRVPITMHPALFKRARAVGERLLWLHTYGERFMSATRSRGRIAPGKARCVRAVPADRAGYPESYSYEVETRTLLVGAGAFHPVSPRAFGFEVSGLGVVESWLRYRMKRRGGRKSSPLDDIRPQRWTSGFATELLRMLWILESTLEGYEEQFGLFNQIVEGECFFASDLAEPADEMRKAPHPPGRRSGPIGLDP